MREVKSCGNAEADVRCLNGALLTGECKARPSIVLRWNAYTKSPARPVKMVSYITEVAVNCKSLMITSFEDNKWQGWVRPKIGTDLEQLVVDRCSTDATTAPAVDLNR